MAVLQRCFSPLNHLKSSIPMLFGHSCRNYAAKSSWAEMYRDQFNKRMPAPPFDFVCQVGDPVLRRKCDLVGEQLIAVPQFQAFIELMWKVHMEYNCVGLSAPQLGIPLQLMVIGCSEEVCKESKSVFMQPIPKKVLINPVIKISNYKDKIVAPENCASMCSYSALVSRFSEVKVEALNEKGEKLAYTATGLESRTIQHEMDHFNGIMFTDKMEPKTLECSLWQTINMQKGKCKLRFKPVKRNSFFHKMTLF